MKIKGTHNAMKSGILAAEELYKKHETGELEGADITEYDKALHNSWVPISLENWLYIEDN